MGPGKPRRSRSPRALNCAEVSGGRVKLTTSGDRHGYPDYATSKVRLFTFTGREFSVSRNRRGRCNRYLEANSATRIDLACIC